MSQVVVVGGGLAGAEAAWQLACRGHRVVLYEMRPQVTTPAHQTAGLAELVCSNSFKSNETTNAHGLLKAELRRLGSLLLRVADGARVPAGAALAVDRRLFSDAVSRELAARSEIAIRREEITALPDAPAIVATGPLTSDPLFDAIRARLGTEGLYFFDAISPIVSGESVDDSKSYRASRYGKGEGDAYINCPLDSDGYEALRDALLNGEIYRTPEWDEVPYFEGCLPVEVLAARGRDALRFGPLKPVGLEDPRTGELPHAVVQLRREDREGRMWNLVGFQTRLRYPEQRAVIRLIPALRSAEILRYGQIHRNSYINYPALLSPHGSPRDEPGLIFAGQLTGVEGYIESGATGLLAALNVDRILRGEEPVLPPPTTMLGGLLRYLREADPRNFQPMNANFGLLEPLAQRIRGKRRRREALAARALNDIERWVDTLDRAGTAASGSG
ncbi:MAG: methylenetetrahydrofolate--tRNA-(uracil(54)-C(5))-methyltransferase (FADH(2)-oxidizing) TrmFO [Gemmatimonadetes bacterium]|uniref:Methylenetetrahydrofolate--tRNA-(uracil-5-)-methyltransferase TrmFO n=1 Tax=Candidatus Kutchimonas denitrificans TaxID=3056748 RepID=A0AAE4Z6R0_9BACT|nr:methylenetetrahydrofolate--tRNA-(uracil(54)-C(5))-methyltransferase (FADH(2)-oxidizing) TrmFO [Gemmatimonadota bacterium]NIR73752.1 methylenetetrahydrofolate--tRNA-(uracil(54)-C(5))-methyltransferase (FADH(2)-oxidizing) TrmFO [Candidatus Kutchimonas denitrificans]NIS03116.1 methylenetetrahydrofolate--tRNA-(uracil(54)-C(5))-methyltransferase (FADH(2)-oxidizing) TrmFO [Gemmatimonadota bacterium]NIT69017.1 methylenetetrahydrofolate--tRNA-(uracil(54)-C(5))-methyltransferase (FADH(2)-oxidizing) Tr